MRKIIFKAVFAIILAVLMARESEMGVLTGCFIALFLYSIISWFGIIYRKLYVFGTILRCIISLLGSVLVISGPMTLLETALPDNWFRTFLIAIVTIIMFVIPFVLDWREYKSDF